jgi:hypothetical protein
MMPAFEDPQAARMWQAYFADVARRLKAVDPDQARELQADLEAHLADSLASLDPTLPECIRLDDAIRRLGRPIDYLRPVVADDLLARGTDGFRPIALARGLYHSLWLGTRWTFFGLIFGLGYLALACLAVLALIKPLWPSHVGMFEKGSTFAGLGALSDIGGTRELLGWWFEPLALCLTAALYVLLTAALRGLRKQVRFRA